MRHQPSHDSRAEVFSSDDAMPMWRNKLSALVKEISDMVKKGEARARFQSRDIRRTAEAILAALNVSKDAARKSSASG